MISPFVHCRFLGVTASIMDIHKAKPPANVSYSKRMPEIEALMQEWPPEVESFLKAMKMPSGDVVSVGVLGHCVKGFSGDQIYMCISPCAVEAAKTLYRRTSFIHTCNVAPARA